MYKRQETDHGKIDIVETELSKYGAVVQGAAEPSSMGLGELDTIELKNELRMAQTRMQMQEDLLNYKDSQIEKMFDLIGSGLKNKQKIEVSPQAIATANVVNQIEVFPEIRDIFEQNFKGIFEGEGSSLGEAIDDCTDSCKINGNADAGKLANLKDKLQTIADGTGSVSKIVANADRGMEVFGKIVDRINPILKSVGISLINMA